MYEIRFVEKGKLVREKFDFSEQLVKRLRTLDKSQLVGVYELSISENKITTSKELPFVVEKDITVLGKPVQ